MGKCTLFITLYLKEIRQGILLIIRISKNPINHAYTRLQEVKTRYISISLFLSLSLAVLCLNWPLNCKLYNASSQYDRAEPAAILKQMLAGNENAVYHYSM